MEKKLNFMSTRSLSDSKLKGLKLIDLIRFFSPNLDSDIRIDKEWIFELNRCSCGKFPDYVIVKASSINIRTLNMSMSYKCMDCAINGEFVGRKG